LLASRRHIWRRQAKLLDSEVLRSGLERVLARLGLEETARRLRAPADLVRAWAAGHATMPERKQRLLLDLLDEISG
jgi:hypothetical protein